MSSAIAVSGNYGSGKTTISRLLAARLDCRHLSLSDGYSTQRGGVIDTRYGGDDLKKSVLNDLAKGDPSVVVDASLAWFFVPDALRVHLVVDAYVGAERLQSHGTPVSGGVGPEEVASVRQAAEQARRVWRVRYGVDVERLRNYDLVVDTTALSPQAAVEEICSNLSPPARLRPSPTMLLAPTRILPTEQIMVLATDTAKSVYDDMKLHSFDRAKPIEVGYAVPYFFAIDGHRRLSAALRLGISPVPCRLGAEDDESVVGGISASAYLPAETSLSRIYDWEHAHGLRFPDYPSELS